MFQQFSDTLITLSNGFTDIHVKIITTILQSALSKDLTDFEVHYQTDCLKYIPYEFLLNFAN